MKVLASPERADEGVGRGPGGPPHQRVASLYTTCTEVFRYNTI
jgi:hypothetical protein